MKTSKILNTAEAFFTFLIGISSLIGLIILSIFIYSYLSPNVFDKFEGNKKNENTSITISENQSFKSNNEKLDFSDIRVTDIGKLTTTSKTTFVLLLIFNFVLFILILKELTNFIRSVRDYHSFHRNNSKYFTKIGKYFSYLLIFEIISNFIPIIIKQDNKHFKSFINIDLGSMLFYTACILLALTISQVFKEGERLKIESELTI